MSTTSHNRTAVPRTPNEPVVTVPRTPSATAASAPRTGSAPTAAPSRRARMLNRLELPLLVAVPLAMAAMVALDIDQAALLMLAVVVAVLALFFMGFDAERPALRQVMPTVVLAALAAAGRILFAPVPDFKPVSAIAIIAGASLGRRSGFMVGALAALTSNFFFGQGMWTPWQMYAWGLVGYVGGVLADAGAFRRSDGSPRRIALVAAGFGLSLLYALVINAYDVIGFVRPITVAGAVTRFAAALPFDLMHAFATMLFLGVLYVPWTRRIDRIVRKYDLRERAGR